MSHSIYQSMFSEHSDLLTVGEVGLILGISRQRVYTLIHEKLLRGIKPGNAFLVPKKFLIDYVLSENSAIVCDIDPVEIVSTS